MKEYYIWLLSVMGAANPRSARLITRFGGVKQAYDALTRLNPENAGFLKPQELRGLRKASLDKSRELLNWCGKNGYGIVTLGDKEYPDLLRHIYNPPILLFTEGDSANINGGVCINVVGTRDPSQYSYNVASALCAGLAATGITIVSGMAVGLDKCAMTAAVENGGKTVGVLACGIDVEYPRGSKEFRKLLIKSGGVLLSELTPRETVRPGYFRYRNRIMSGMSSGTLIIEAGERSGCHITAAHAVSQNRDLFCVPPHDILDPRYYGVVRYLREGAIPVFNHADIIREYVTELAPDTGERTASANPGGLDKKRGSKSVKPAKLTEKTPVKQPAPSADYSALSEERAAIVAALQIKPLTFDEITAKKLCAADGAYETLLDMELDGLIERAAGDSYRLTVDN